MKQITDRIDSFDNKFDVMGFTLGVLQGFLNEDRYTSHQKVSKMQYILGYATGALKRLPD